MNHKENLDRLYGECDRAFGEDYHKAVDNLSDYLEAHNLTLAQISKIRGDYNSVDCDSSDFELA